MKTRPQTVPAKRPPTPDPRDVVCPHQHFKYDIIDRDILSRKQHLNLLCTPKGYRWVVMKDDPADLTPDEIASNPCKVAKKKPGKTYVHNILAELWGLLTPEMVIRLKEMLMVEFGLSEEAAVDFICHSRHDTLRIAHRTKRKRGVEEVEHDDVAEQDPTLPRLIVEPKLCNKSQFAVGIDPCHIREFSRIVSTKFSEYVVAMMCARRNNRHRRMAEVVLNGLCNLTGENTTLGNPKNRLHKILTITADRVALWLAQNMDDEDIKRDRRRKKEDEALRKKRREKQKEQERRRKEKERMNKEIERNKRRKEKEEEEKEKQKQEEQDKKKAEREKRRQEMEKFREEDKKKRQEEKNKSDEDGGKKKPEKKARGEVKDDNQKSRAKSAGGGDGGGGRRAKTEGKKSSTDSKGQKSGARGGRSQQRTAPATKTASSGRSGGTTPSRSSKSPSSKRGGGAQSGDPNESAGAGGGEGEEGGTSLQPADENATEGTDATASTEAPGGETGSDRTPTDDTSASTEPVSTGATGEGADSGEGGAADTIPGTPAAGPDQGEPTPDRPSKERSDVAPIPGESGTERGPVSAQASDEGKGVQPTGPAPEKSLEEKIISATTSQIGDIKPVPTPRQETLQDLLIKELEKRIEPTDRETSEIIKEVASKTATWIDQNVKDAEIEYGSRDKIASRTSAPVSQKPKGPLYVLRKIDPVKQTYEVSTATYTEAGKKIRTLRRNASGRNITSAPTNPSDPKMWAKWAENASEMADDWGRWIDKTIQDAEDKAVQYQANAKEGITQPEDEEDWSRFVETTNEHALTWRRKKKSFDEAAKEWKLHVPYNEL